DHGNDDVAGTVEDHRFIQRVDRPGRTVNRLNLLIMQGGPVNRAVNWVAVSIFIEVDVYQLADIDTACTTGVAKHDPNFIEGDREVKGIRREAIEPDKLAAICEAEGIIGFSTIEDHGV